MSGESQGKSPLLIGIAVTVAVLGNETAETLFPLSDPLGHSVRVGDSHFYQVIGVTEKRAPSAGVGSSLAAQDFNRDIYIPFNTDKVRFGSVVTYFGASSVSFGAPAVSVPNDVSAPVPCISGHAGRPTGPGSWKKPSKKDGSYSAGTATPRPLESASTRSPCRHITPFGMPVVPPV